MKQISLDGRIGKDAQVSTTKGGRPYVRFSVANNSFEGGTEKTEWFDITSYDPYIIENRVKYLSKGKYVIINGKLRTEVTTKDGRIYVNQYVTATNIDEPQFGAKKDDADNNEPKVSTYSRETVTEEVKPQPQPSVSVAGNVSTTFNPSDYPSVNYDDNSSDDGLPF